MRVGAVRDLAATVRGRRRDLGLTQTALADRADVSRRWLQAFEAGKGTAALDAVLRVVAALDLRLEITAGDAAEQQSPKGKNGVDLDALLETYRHR